MRSLSPLLLVSLSIVVRPTLQLAGATEGFLMLRAGQKLGKYRLLTKLSVGTFATVFRAFDTLEGVYVALKIPHPNLMNKDALADFTKEVKLAARLDHPNILG